MATLLFARTASARKPLSAVPKDDNLSHSELPAAGQSIRSRRSPTPHLTVDQYVRLLACIEHEGGIATLDEISRALPRVIQPISAVFDLCDAGILCADYEAAFDGDMRVWRVDR